MISISDSFFDWEKRFKKKSNAQSKKENEKITELGIPESQFKEFLKKWKEENLKNIKSEKND